MTTFAWCAAVFVAAGRVTAAGPVAPPKTAPVPAVTDIKYVYEEKQPGDLVITVKGMVPTGGWTAPTLAPRPADKPPADGVYGFDLTATPPDGPATQALTEVTATYKWVKVPDGVKGLKVYGVGDGVKTVTFGGEKK